VSVEVTRITPQSCRWCGCAYEAGDVSSCLWISITGSSISAQARADHNRDDFTQRIPVGAASVTCGKRQT